MPFCSQAQLIVINPKYVSGILVDNETSRRISFVHILNESLRLSAISDTSGRFTIRAKSGDTLVFGVLGYLGRFIVLNDTAFKTGLSVSLIPRTYEIAEVEVFAITSYTQFKEKFQRLKLPRTETDVLRENLQQVAQEIGKEAKYEMAMKQAAEGGNLMSAPILSPEEIQRIKLKQILKDDKIQAEIDKKYNRHIVGNLTGLKDLELDEFMLFCKFDRKFLQFGSQYDILVKVLEKLAEFKELKKKGSIQYIKKYDFYTSISGYTESSNQN